MSPASFFDPRVRTRFWAGVILMIGSFALLIAAYAYGLIAGQARLDRLRATTVPAPPPAGAHVDARAAAALLSPLAGPAGDTVWVIAEYRDPDYRDLLVFDSRFRRAHFVARGTRALSIVGWTASGEIEVADAGDQRRLIDPATYRRRPAPPGPAAGAADATATAAVLDGLTGPGLPAALRDASEITVTAIAPGAPGGRLVAALSAIGAEWAPAGLVEGAHGFVVTAAPGETTVAVRWEAPDAPDTWVDRIVPLGGGSPAAVIGVVEGGTGDYAWYLLDLGSGGASPIGSGAGSGMSWSLDAPRSRIVASDGDALRWIRVPGTGPTLPAR